MYFITILFIIGECLAFNPTLERVAINRQNIPVEVKIEKDVNIDKYECLIGVPYGHKDLIGQEVYFISFETEHYINGPWLVVDVEAKHHSGIMDSRDLLADTNCEEFVHKRGRLVIIND